MVGLLVERISIILNGSKVFIEGIPQSSVAKSLSAIDLKGTEDKKKSVIDREREMDIIRKRARLL